MPQVPKHPAATLYLQYVISYQSSAQLNPSSTNIFLGFGAQEAGSTVTYTLSSLTRNTDYDIQIRAQVQFSACSVSMFSDFSDLMTFRTNNTCAYHKKLIKICMTVQKIVLPHCDQSQAQLCI